MSRRRRRTISPEVWRLDTSDDWNLFSRLKLVDHALNFGDCGTGRFVPEEFEGVHVFGLLRLFARLDDHSTFHPHFNPVRDGQMRAFRNEHGSKLCVSGAQNLVIESLCCMSANAQT